MKKLKNYIFPVLAIFLFTLTITAQDFEVGQPSELKGLTRVFIGGVGDIENTKKIIEIIKKSKPENLQIVKKPEDADFIVMFYGNQRRYRTGNSKTSYFVGTGTVFLPRTSDRRMRVLVQFYGKPGEKNQPAKFARTFLEEYRKANRII
jgi:hypothetical protein